MATIQKVKAGDVLTLAKGGYILQIDSKSMNSNNNEARILVDTVSGTYDFTLPAIADLKGLWGCKIIFVDTTGKAGDTGGVVFNTDGTAFFSVGTKQASITKNYGVAELSVGSKGVWNITGCSPK